MRIDERCMHCAGFVACGVLYNEVPVSDYAKRSSVRRVSHTREWCVSRDRRYGIKVRGVV